MDAWEESWHAMACCLEIVEQLRDWAWHPGLSVCGREPEAAKVNCGSPHKQINPNCSLFEKSVWQQNKPFLSISGYIIQVPPIIGLLKWDLLQRCNWKMHKAWRGMQLGQRRISSSVRCQDVRCKMPSRQEPNLELTGKICELLPAQRSAFLQDVSGH